MSRILIAAAQIECRPGDIAANLDLHVAAIGEARERGVDVLANVVKVPKLGGD